MTRIHHALTLLVLLAACSDPPPPADAPAFEDESIEAEQTSPTVERPAPELTIRPDGIGTARIGMTVGALRAALPPDLVLGEKGPYLVDIDGVPVLRGADTLYVVLFPVGERITDESVIELLATTNPGVRTVDGIGPGMTLGAAAALGGEPRLAYNTADESREWAHFPYVQPSIMVRVQSVIDGELFAGEYMTAGEYNETSQYDADAVVMMIVVRKE